MNKLNGILDGNVFRKVALLMVYLIPFVLAGNSAVYADMGSESEAVFYVM